MNSKKRKKLLVKNESIWSFLVLQRDSNTCQICGAQANLGHHIIDREENSNLILEVDNGISLCYKCHGLFKIGTHHKWHPVTYKGVRTEEELQKICALQDAKYKTN